jgi:hypothetical protein
MNLSDIFVIHEDIQYIKGGWINRNRLLTNGHPHLFTFALKKQSYLDNINVRVFIDFMKDSANLMRFIKSNYKKAPYFEPTWDLLFKMMHYYGNYVSEYDINTLKSIVEYLNIHCLILKSSELVKNDKLHGQDRVIEIVKVLGGDHYINPIGGTELYTKKDFEDQGIKLNFLKADFDRMQYKQFDKPFVPGLSIIDVLMFNSVDWTKEFLNYYNLV